MSDRSDLSTEIEELRRAIYWTRCLGGLLILGLATMIAAGRIRHPIAVEAGQMKTVEANQFLLKDNAGNLVARLGAQRIDGTCLTLSAKENAAAKLCVGEDGSSSLVLSKKGGQSSVSLSTGNNAAQQGMELAQVNTGLQIWKDGGKNSVDLVVGSDGISFFMGHGENPSVVISTSKDKSLIDLFGQGGRRVWSAP